MLNKIISFSVKNKLIIGLFVLALGIWGAYEVTKLPIDALPDITDNQVQVITVSPSLGAPDIERLVTFPIEQAVSNIPGLKQVRSFSRFGLSLITIVFDDDTEIYWARQQITERLQQVKQQIPESVGSPELAPVSTGLGEIYQYVVRPKPGYEQRYNAMELRTIQDWIVRRQLLGTPGVAEVSSFGGQLKQYEIAVRQQQLRAYGLTIGDVFEALEKNNQNTGGAYIEKGPTVLYIRSEGLTTSLDDIGKIVVRSLENGVPLLVRDIADVQFGSAIRYGAMTFNDIGEVAGAVVMMLKGENSSQVVNRVKARVAEIQKMLPEGVIVEPFLDRTKMVNHAISTVETNLLEGALIVIFVLVFFLGNLRAGLIVSSVIPLSMLFAIILMNRFGVGGNLMSLGAIDFGLIVDGSVIVVEAILHRFSHSKHFRLITRVTQPQMDDEVSRSTGSMIKSAVFSQIIILIVYLPILSLQGIEGKMFKPMAFTIAFAIFGAFILSVTYVPMMCALFLNKKISHKKNITDRMMIWLERRYQPVLSRLLNFPKTIIASTVAVFGISVVVLLGMGGEFIPQLEEGDFAVETRLLTGSNLNNTINSTQQASKLLLTRFPEVEKVVTKIGSAEIPTDPMPFEAGDMMVILKDKKDWTSATSFPELSDKMTKVLEEVPGITVGFQFPVQMRFNELMTGARQDVVCKIFGEDLDSLAAYAHRLTAIIQSVKGAINIYEERVTGMPQVVIKYNREAMARYGLNVSDINRVVNSGFAGEIAGEVYEGEKRFDMVVRLAGETRKNITDVQNLLVTAGSGLQIPLSYVATIAEVEGVNQIQRENTRRRIIVGFNVSGKDVQTIVQELQAKVANELSLGKGYTIVYGGSFENMTAAKERLGIVVPIALLLIFLLLYFAFNSMKQGLLIYTAIPLSATGGIFALWLRDMPFSISAGVGFIALFGVAVLNGILLVTEFNRLKAEGWTDSRRIVLHATKAKLRAVLMTALVPSLGFIPMAISTGAGGEVQKPLATVVIGGLMISTILTLVVLPVLYLAFEKGFRYLKTGRTVAMLFLLFALSNGQVYAQKPIRLKQAIDTAFRSNAALNALRAETRYLQALQRTNVDIDKTAVTFEYGQLNTIAIDNRFAISQGVQFPAVYKNQRAVNVLNVTISELNVEQAAIELRARIKRVFYSLVILDRRRLLLNKADSVYAEFLNRARLRLKAGDTDVLEVVSAENQQLQIANQIRQLTSERVIQQAQLKLLLNTPEELLPVADTLVYEANNLPPSDALSASPLLQSRQRQIDLATAQRKLEKSRMLPTLFVGFNSMTIVGWQAIAQGTEKYYGSSKRFNSVSVGLGIPFFSTAQRARITASGLFTRQRELELFSEKQALETDFTNARTSLIQTEELVRSYQKTLLPNAAKLISVSTQKLNAGELNYFNWAIIINQAIGVEAEHLTNIQQLNESIFTLERIGAK